MRNSYNFCLLLFVIFLSFSCKKTETLAFEEAQVKSTDVDFGDIGTTDPPSPDNPEGYCGDSPFIVTFGQNFPALSLLAANVFEGPSSGPSLFGGPLVSPDSDPVSHEITLTSVCPALTATSWSVGQSTEGSPILTMVTSGWGKTISFDAVPYTNYVITLSGNVPLGFGNLTVASSESFCLSVGGAGYVSLCDGTDTSIIYEAEGPGTGGSVPAVIVPDNPENDGDLDNNTKVVKGGG